ncbi:hypothetical protein [Methylibium sp.]|uniref:hypothetical protein n=1 Tax=Methylibium sp. TaxID=2067992 RepID=UPI003D11B299
MSSRLTLCASVASLLILAAACAPALDWREVRPDGGGLVALFPCKPERLTRQLALAGATVQMQVLACTAEGTTWGLSTADMADPGIVGTALAELRVSRVRNLDGAETASQAAQIAGMTPQPRAVRFSVAGRKPDGTPIADQSVLFALGTRVFHAAALGGQPSAQTLETFFGGLKVQP